MSLSFQNQMVKETAQKLGFHQIGITHLRTSDESSRQLQEWIQEGRHGEMKYLEDFQKRQNRFFEKTPQAKKVIVLGVNYHSGKSSVEKTGRFPNQYGRVASYARGLDYHQVIKEKHENFIEALRRKVEKDFYAESCIDVRPLLERSISVRAGLGFFGKNTMLLSQDYGPWLFLSEIVTDLELEEDLAAEGDCGTCHRCQVQCPTGALDRDYQMDARKCIAYLTIEHKGVIPKAIRPKMKNWIFGCDECLTSCPFTSKEKETDWNEFKVENGAGEFLDLDQLFSLHSNQDYEKVFAKTPLLRARRKQMLRNACIVLGNFKSPKALTYLEKGLKDTSPLVRQHAVWAVGQIATEEAQRLLHQTLKSESDTNVMGEIQEALQEQAEV